jgi:formylglycine-generating enzyme required for sulfatase activity
VSAPRLRLLVLGPARLCAGQLPPRVTALTHAFAPGGALARQRPDLVLVTGDLAATGAAEEYQTAESALRALAQATQVPLGRVVVVPGNHDIDRARVSRRFVLDIPDAEAAEEFFAEREDVAVALRRFKPFLQFHQRVFDRLIDADTPVQICRLTVAGLTVGILGLNSAWMAHQDRGSHPLIVGHRAVREALDTLEAPGRPDLILAVVHHPPGQWAPFEQALVEPLLQARCDLTLHGPGATPPSAALSAPPLCEGALWLDLHPDTLHLSQLSAPDGWAATTHTRPLPRALPHLPSPAPTVAGTRPPDLTSYLRHIDDEWGHILLTGLLRDRAQAAVDVREIYVSLRTLNPLIPVDPDASGNLQRAPVERLRQRLLTAGADPTPEDRAAIRAALEAVGVPPSHINPVALEHTWNRLIHHPDRADFDVVARSLQTLDLDLAIASGRKMLIEGDPGTGKTTTLQHVAIALVDAWRGQPQRALAMGFTHPFPLPIFVPMRRFWRWLARRPDAFAAGGARLLLDYLRATLVQHAGGDAWIEPALRDGRVALLLDGLDEVPHALDRERAAGAVRDFVHRFEPCWYGITSRPAGLGPTERHALERAGLTLVRVQPLEPDQIRGFVHAWYAALIPDPRAARLKAHDLLSRIAGNPLTTTPVTLIAIAIVHHTLGDLPERRAELYEHCVQALCGRWDDSKEEAGPLLAGGLTRSAKVHLLQRLAHAIHQGHSQRLERGPALDTIQAAYDAPERPTREDAQTQLELLAARSGLLIPDAHHAWRFRHLTFQEYLTARYICAEHADAADALAGRLDDPRWREVLLLAVGYKAKDAAVQGRHLLTALADAAQRRTTAESRVRALSVVAQALIDLDGYHVSQLDALAAQLAPQFTAILADPTQPGGAEARIWLAEALGHFDDPRLGYQDHHLALIPAGPFTAGDPHGAPEAPLTTIELPAYRMARHPVTRAQFAAFIDADGYHQPALWAAGGPAKRNLTKYRARLDAHPNHPVTEVDWYEANAYCAWLNTAHPRTDGLTWRLPTTAQWEKAARGGPTLPDGQPNPCPTRLYPWGDDWRVDYVNGWKLRAQDETTPVGCFPAGAGPYGTLDQAGNVDEWCLDIDPDTGGRAYRGGYFLAGANLMQSWWHSSGEPGWHSDGVGFRVVAG